MKSLAEIIGEYVLWLEQHADNNLMQSLSYGLIANAPKWYAEMQKEGDSIGS